MRFVFFVQASETIGLGHLMRCLALSQTITELELEAVFLLDSESLSYAHARHDWQGAVVPHDYSRDLEKQYASASKYVCQPDTWVIIDGYQFNDDFCKQWKADGNRVLLLDDGEHPTQLPVDAVLNPARSADGKPNHLFGSAFRLLRREFRFVSRPTLSNRHYAAINFGGSDPLNLTLPLLRQLDISEFTGPIRVVTGSAYGQLQELKAFVKSSSLAIQHIHDAQDMADIWENARIAVSAAGGSQFELAVCGTPSLLVVVAKNQIPASLTAEQEGWCIVEQIADTATLNTTFCVDSIAETLIHLWNDEQRLLAMQQAIPPSYDSLGCERVIQRLLEIY